MSVKIKHGPRLWGNELQLFRAHWTRGDWLDGCGYGAALSLKIIWEPRDLWIGVYWTTDSRWRDNRIVYLCLLPCLPIRLHYQRSYGGRFG